jgi:hypothetical protein
MADYRRQKTEDGKQMVGCANVFFAHAVPGVYCSVCSYKTSCTPYCYYCYFRHLTFDF